MRASTAIHPITTQATPSLLRDSRKSAKSLVTAESSHRPQLKRAVEQANHRIDAVFLRRGESVGDLLPQKFFSRRVKATAAAVCAMVHQ